MVTFDSKSLFESGTTGFLIGPIRLRHTIQYAPGSIGAQLDSQGTEARQIKQIGEFIANSPSELQAHLDAIREKLDGLPYTLIDNLGRTWPDAVMTEVKAEVFVRVGARWKTAYQIKYVQVIP